MFVDIPVSIYAIYFTALFEFMYYYYYYSHLMSWKNCKEGVIACTKDIY